MTVVLKNITRVGDRATAGKQIHYKLFYAHVSQIDGDQSFPVPNANREIAALPLLSGQYLHYLEVVDYSPEDKSTSSKGDITSTVENTVAFTLGGNREAILDFIENNQGEAFYLILQEVDSGKKWLYGRQYMPMILNAFERNNNKDGRYTTITFGNPSFDQPLIYVGALSLAAPTDMAADATTLAISASGQYKTPSANTAAKVLGAISGTSASDEGRIIEIIGGGGTNPTTIEDGTVFVLRNGTTWTGTAGSRIAFRILDSATLIEVSRTQL